MTEIQGRVAVVTGGGSGIGRGLAKLLAKEGAKVCVADIVADQAQAVADEIAAAGGTAIAAVCDVSDRASVTALKAQAERALGPVRLLFANAGVTAFLPFAEMTETHIRWLYEVNLLGVVNSVHVFLPDLIAAGEGHICATASMAGLAPTWLPIHAPYTSTKAGIVGLMMNLRGEVAKAGIGISVLCPGAVTSGMIGSARYRPDRFGGPSDELVTAPADFLMTAAPAFKSEDEVAPMILAGVRNNRAVIVTDATMRGAFVDHFVDPVMQAFDDAEAFAARQDSSG